MPRLVLVAAALALASGARASPITLIHSGFVLDTNDAAVTNPSVPAVFRLFNVRDRGGTGEQLVWESATCNIEIRAGYYAVALGETCNGPTPLDSSHLPPTATRYLEVSLAGASLAPRMLFGTLPHAAVAQTANVAKGLSLADGAGSGLALLSDAGGTAAWGRVGAAGLADGAVTNAAIAANAAIATSKLSGPLTAVSGHGLGALAAKAAIADGDVAVDAAIATSKLSGPLTAVSGHGLGALAAKGTIADADVAASAAIAGTKIAPAFGTQNVTTTGSVSASYVVASGAAPGLNSNLVASSAGGSDSAVSIDQNGVGHWRLVVPGGTSDLRFDTAGSTHVAMKASGNIGIGTTNPQARLELGAGSLLYSANPYNNLLLRHSDDDVKLDFVKKDNTTSSGYVQFNGYGAANAPYTGLDIYTRALNDGAAAPLAPRIVVDAANGNVGIGKVSPTAKLDVAGTIRENGQLLSDRYVPRFEFSLDANTNWFRFARIVASDYAIVSSNHNSYPNVYMVTYSGYPETLAAVQPNVRVIGGYDYGPSVVEFRRVVVNEVYYLEIRGTSAHGKLIKVSGHGIVPL